MPPSDLSFLDLRYPASVSQQLSSIDCGLPTITDATEGIGSACIAVPVAVPERQLQTSLSDRSGFSVFHSLDACRGIAAVAVVFFHAGLIIKIRRCGGLAPGGIFPTIAFGYLGVPVFFVISGYCIAAASASAIGPNGRTPLGFLGARLRRIFPAYWISLFPALVVAVIGDRLRPSDDRATYWLNAGVSFDIRYWLSNITLTQPIFNTGLFSPVSWTLCYEMAFYLAMCLGIAAMSRRGGLANLLAAAHSCTMLCLLLMIAGMKVRFPFDLWPQFGLGILVFDLLAQPRNRRAIGFAIVVGLSTICLIVMRSGSVGLFDHPLRLTYLCAGLFALCLLILRRWDVKVRNHIVGRCLSAVGLVSYSLYLTHPVIIIVVNKAFTLLCPHKNDFLLQLAVSVAASILFGVLFWNWAERPFVRRKREPRLSAGRTILPASRQALALQKH